MLKKYDTETEQNMKSVFKTLNEKQKRLYAATEAKKLGHGGNKYISELLSISPKTIYTGQQELKQLEKDPDSNINGIRRPGGGRKKKIENNEELKKTLKLY